MKKNLLAILRTLVFVLPLSMCFVSCEGFDLEELFGNIIKPGGDEDEDGDSEKSYYQIAPEDLNGWDEGVFYGNEDGAYYSYYIVSQTDTTDGTITVCLNEAANADADKSLIFHFSKEGDVLKIILRGYHLDAQSYDEKVDFIVYDTEDNAVGGFSVPYIRLDSMQSTRYSSPFFNSKGEFSVSKTLNFAEFAKQGADVLGNIVNFSEGNYDEIISDYLLGKIAGTVAKSFVAELFVPEVLKSFLQLHYERLKNSYMGNASIEITSVKRTSDTTIDVEGVISNASSIPSSHYVVYDGLPGFVDNKVVYGVAVGSNDHPGLYLNENCTSMHYVSEGKYSFTFYADVIPGKVYYFRPFLVPEGKLWNEDEIFPDWCTCIRYGEAKKFMDMSVDLSNFKQVKCTKVGKEYDVQFTIDGKIPGLFDDLQNWGVKVETESQKTEFWGGDRYYADKSGSISLSTEMSFTCNVKIKEDDIEDLGEERIAKVTITPFVEVGFNLVNTYLVAEDYTISITNNLCPDANHVHAVDLGLSVKWACCNVGASVPEGYGGYYAWGETEEKSDYTNRTYKYWSDKDGDGYNDPNEYQNIGSNISGTSYDVAHVKWGGSWRMPTLDEIMELCNKCSWEWTEVNGIKGQKVTGPNGNSIFLPAAGSRKGTEVNNRGSNGYNWSGTLYEYYSYGAYSLNSYSAGLYCLCSDYYTRYYGYTVRPVTE